VHRLYKGAPELADLSAALIDGKKQSGGRARVNGIEGR